MQDCDTEHDRSQDLDFVETFAEGTVRCLTDVVNRLIRLLEIVHHTSAGTGTCSSIWN